MIVGIHNDLNDTAFTKIPFLRTSKTNERGEFTIKNIAPGKYHLFALDDQNKNYSYDKERGEALAFIDSIIIPSCERAIVPDTIWKDTINIDTIQMVEKTLFYPDSLTLWFFCDSIAPRQKMMRPDRLQDHIFTLKFNAPLDTFPTPIPLNFEPSDSIWYIPQRSNTQEGFSINYWILDSMIYKIDTLEVEVTYWQTNDSVPNLMDLCTDTLKLVNKETAMRKRRATKPKKPVKATKDESADTTEQKTEDIPVIPLEISVSPSALNPYDVIAVSVNEPVLNVKKEHFIFEQERDSAWMPVEFIFSEDSSRAMTYLIKHTFNYDEKYRLTIDSACMRSVYGHCNDSVSIEMAVRSEKEYGHLIISIEGLPALDDSSQIMPAFMELLDNGGNVARKAIAENGIASFMDMAPGKYYARITLDANGNGRWDYGSYEEKRQPEKVIYFASQFEIRENWKIEETWDISKSSTTQKPIELLKNKPKEETKKKRDYKEESRPKNSSSSSTSFGGLGSLMGR